MSSICESQNTFSLCPHYVRRDLGFAPLARIPRAIAFCDPFAQLCVDCGLPSGLGALNIWRDELPDLARDAMTQARLLKNNPRPVTQANALAIYEAAF